LTGAGGTALPFLINLLREQGYRVLAADMDYHAVGLYLADKGFVIPKGGSESFLSCIESICRDENVSAIVPLVDEELLSCLCLEKRGVRVILPCKKFVEMCLDKRVLMTCLCEKNILVPRTFVWEKNMSCCVENYFPLLVKPRVGRGSRGVQIFENRDQLRKFMGRNEHVLSDYIIQKYIEGEEYTVSVVVWRDGKIRAVVPKKIISKQGVTKIAVTQKNKEIEEVCYKIQEKFQANGPFNVQLKLDVVTGKPFVFEINPRFSTSVSLTIAAGVDEIGAILAQVLLGKKMESTLEFEEGKVLLRQTLDSFVDHLDFLKVKESIIGREKNIAHRLKRVCR
jgi:carbamoyl-phosphate synthase large subunit